MKHITTPLKNNILLLLGLNSLILSSCDKKDPVESESDTDRHDTSSDIIFDSADTINPNTTDDDGDGQSEIDGDCNDSNPDIYVGAEETCDGTDNNCSGDETDAVDTSSFHQDSDNDGYGDISVVVSDCFAPAGFVNDSTDCDDTKDTVYPDAPEICDGLDNNCNVDIDEGLDQIWYKDTDGDGYGIDTDTVLDCSIPSGFSAEPGDCNDNDASISPEQSDIIDATDNNCNRLIDEQVCQQAAAPSGPSDIENAYMSNQSTGPYQLCYPLPSNGASCPGFAMYTYPKDIVYQVVGQTTDTFTDWFVTSGCGPDIGTPTECCYVLDIGVDYLVTPGRPLVIDGQQRLARGEFQPLDRKSKNLNFSNSKTVTTHWSNVAKLEHASIASFANLTLNLMHHGAPLELIEGSTKAQQDELVHAKLALDIVSYFGGSLSLNELDLSGLSILTIEELLIETIRDACINESLAAAEARLLSTVTKDPLQKSLKKISQDETEHAALGWKILKWIISKNPQLRQTAMAHFKAQSPDFYHYLGEMDFELASCGLLSQKDALNLRQNVWQDVIWPCADVCLKTV